MTNSIGHGNEVSAPPIRRKNETQHEQGRETAILFTKNPKRWDKNRGHTPAACGSRFFFSIKYSILKM